MKSEFIIVCVGAIVIFLAIASRFVSSAPRNTEKDHMRMAEQLTRVYAGSAFTKISGQVAKHATNEVDVENIIRDYFSKLRRDPNSKRLEFYISRDVETWKEIDMRNGGLGRSNIVWCIKTCEGFPHEWLVMRVPWKWECGDFSIINPNFIKSSLVEYCSYYGLSPSESENTIILPNYKYGAVSTPVQDEEAAAAE